MQKNYLESLDKQFRYYKMLGERTMAQLTDEQLLWRPSPEGNSIGTIVHHLSGNMLSRFTHFLSTDGEKPWRQRDLEFEPVSCDRHKIFEVWEAGWATVFEAMQTVEGEDLEQVIYIRNQGHTIVEAFNRQSTHYAYHIGQMVLIGKTLKKEDWSSLSIPKVQSAEYNSNKFRSQKSTEHYTKEWMEKN
ncbi:MAG: DUF1572 family protein [Bacteroidota bacterium]